MKAMILEALADLSKESRPLQLRHIPEPVPGDNELPDCVVSDDLLSFCVRAEREAGNENGRRYEVSVAAADDIVDHPDKLTFKELNYKPPKPADFRAGRYRLSKTR